MGSLMPAMAGVAERLVPCRVAAKPLARSRGGRGRVPPFPRPPRWLPTGKALGWKVSKISGPEPPSVYMVNNRRYGEFTT